MLDDLAALPRTQALDALGLSRATFYRRRARRAAHPTPPASPAQAPPLPPEAKEHPPQNEAFFSLVEGAAPAVPEPRGAAEALEAAPSPVTPRLAELSPALSRSSHFRRLKEEDEARVLEVLDSERFVDKSPRAVWATLLEEGVYLCHWRTMYRLMARRGPVPQRRPQRTHPRRAAPDLEARAPMQVWCWDITRLPGSQPGEAWFLYTVLDLYSRYVVGWRVEEVERGELAVELFETLCERWEVAAGTLVVHADRGGPMRAQPLVELLERLGVGRSHSRPRVSDDNPFIEAHFKTMKYGKEWPSAFESEEDAREWVREFVPRYNTEHRHSGLGLLTPAQVHSGQANLIQDLRQQVLDHAAQLHPERFVHGKPRLPQLPDVVRIGKPNPCSEPQRPNTEVNTQPTLSPKDLSHFH